MPDTPTNPLMDGLKEKFEGYLHQVQTHQLRILLPDAHARIMNMIFNETISYSVQHTEWPDTRPSANNIRLDFIYSLTGAGGGLSEVSTDHLKALWHLLKPNRDMQGHWHMNDDCAIRMCGAMKQFYRLKLPTPVEASHE